ncbi:MAG: response regulator [candidate division KSB1 bacterium]|nr:response regulator [candidate division KSB1 bacterium]MDZ7366038.1 response regulator [candidate division KSB1 bacterium]MDZ7404155.1 response regulator [candidate division KSB1 bacterium]
MPKRILFIEDEDWSVTPYFQQLQDHNIEIDLASNGDEAINRLQENTYNLIVLDIMFPPGNKIGKDVEPRKAGAILLHMIRRNQILDMKTAPEVPMVVLTAVTDQRLSESIRQLGVNEIFQKPAPFDEVTDKLLTLAKADMME